MTDQLIPDPGNYSKELPKVGVYAISLTGVTQTVMHMGIYRNADEAVETAIDHVATNKPDLHQQVIERKGQWDVAIQYIPHMRAVEMFNILLESEPPEPIALVGAEVKKPEPKPEPVALTPEQEEKKRKNTLMEKLIKDKSLDQLELFKDDLTKAEYQYVYDEIK